MVYVESETDHDLVVLDPNWLGQKLIGGLLSHERLMQTRPTGCFTKDDLEVYHVLVPDVNTADALPILEALELCTPCDVDGDVEFEFPCFNFIETLSGLWEANDRQQYASKTVYGGVRLRPPAGAPHLLIHQFPRLQVQLRRDFLQNHNSADCDLYQWYHGSKYCTGSMEAMITLELGESVLDIKCRGPGDSRAELFYFFEDIYHIVMDSLSDMCPGLGLERYLLSPSQLAEHVPSMNLYAYPPRDILTAQLNNVTDVEAENGRSEPMVDLICFGSQEILSAAVLGVDLLVAHLNVHARRRVCAILDPADPMGRDWCLLAVTLGLSEALPQLDAEPPQHTRQRSKTDRALEVWSRSPDATIGQLVKKLTELGRDDAAQAVLSYAPLFHIFQEDSSQVEPPSPQQSPVSDGTDASR